MEGPRQFVLCMATLDPTLLASPASVLGTKTIFHARGNEEKKGKESFIKVSQPGLLRKGWEARQGADMHLGALWPPAMPFVLAWPTHCPVPGSHSLMSSKLFIFFGQEAQNP